MTFQAHSFAAVKPGGGARDLWLHLEHARLSLLRGFDELLCLEGLTGVEHLPHQIETVRRVLRQFRGRVLLADEVGLGKTIEACLLLREYVLRSLVKRVLILVPAPLVSQWQDELHGKFHLDFTVPPKTAEADQPEYWSGQDRVLMSLTSAKAKKRSALVAAQQWDLVIVDEAHHCKNRATLNWQVVNSLQRRFMFLLTATPVQNNLVELYNLLTLLAPGHLKTEADFKKQFVTRGNPRDPRNRERLRTLLGEVMVRNTRSLVNLDLPPRYAQTIHATPGETEALLYLRLDEYLRRRGSGLLRTTETSATDANGDDSPDWSDSLLECSLPIGGDQPEAARKQPETAHKTPETTGKQRESGLNRMQLSHLLAAQGSHPSAVQNSLENMASPDDESRALVALAKSIAVSAKDQRLLELMEQSKEHKILVFVNYRRTLQHLSQLLTQHGIAFSVFSGEQNDREKDAAVAALRDTVSVMLCTDSGGEGRNLQFADTLINYDLPWNPMKIEQRIGRVHRFGQTRDVYVFNLCTSGSLEDRLLKVLSDKIRMFELVVGEVGSILGNLDESDQFESLVLGLWLQSRDANDLDKSFETLGNTLLDAQAKYVEAKELDEALFGDDYE